jgi:hypothetical protein
MLSTILTKRDERKLEIEITESMVMEDWKVAETSIERIRVCVPLVLMTWDWVFFAQLTSSHPL